MKIVLISTPDLRKRFEEKLHPTPCTFISITTQAHLIAEALSDARAGKQAVIVQCDHAGSDLTAMSYLLRYANMMGTPNATVSVPVPAFLICTSRVELADIAGKFK